MKKISILTQAGVCVCVCVRVCVCVCVCARARLRRPGFAAGDLNAHPQRCGASQLCGTVGAFQTGLIHTAARGERGARIQHGEKG